MENGNFEYLLHLVHLLAARRSRAVSGLMPVASATYFIVSLLEIVTVALATGAKREKWLVE